MTSLFLFSNALFTLLILCSPLLIGLALATALWKSDSTLRRRARNAALIAIGFGLLDLALLAALPRLNLSYGPLAIPLAAWWGMRYLLYLTWVLAARLPQVQHRKPAHTAVFATLNLALAALLLYGFYFEPFNLGVTVLEHRMDSPGSQALRIVQVSDIHLERITAREREMLALVAAQQPDLIVLTGDYLNLSNLNDPVAIEQARQVLGQLSAPLGVVAVNGTVDGPYLMQALFDGLDVTVLDNQVHEIVLEHGSLYLVGVSNHGYAEDAANLATLMGTLPAGAETLLLYHTPDLVETAAQTGVGLYLAGHTHGGQVRLPVYGALITLSRYGKRYEMGDYQVGRTRLYVSRGIGLEGSFAPRVRFLCPPEIVVINLAGSP